MGGDGKQPSEETIVDTTNVGLLNMSNTGMTYFGVGEVLTVLVLILSTPSSNSSSKFQAEAGVRH